MITDQMTKHLIYCWTSCSEELQEMTIGQEISHQQNCCIRHQWHTYLKTSSLEYRIWCSIFERYAHFSYRALPLSGICKVRYAVLCCAHIYREELHSRYKISAMNHNMNSFNGGLVQLWICPAVDSFSGGQARS